MVALGIDFAVERVRDQRTLNASRSFFTSPSFLFFIICSALANSEESLEWAVCIEVVKVQRHIVRQSVFNVLKVAHEAIADFGVVSCKIFQLEMPL